MRKTLLGGYLLALAGVVAVTPSAQAQSEKDAVAAAAIMLTPAGSFASVSPAAFGDRRTGAGVDYGRYTGDLDQRNSFGVHFDWRALRATVGATTDLFDENVWMAGLSAGRSLVSANLVHVGVEGLAGYGRISEAGESLTALTLGARVPFSMAFGGDAVTVTPYLAPGGFMGRLSAAGDSETGFRATLNGGVRLGLNNGVGIEIGAQRIFIDEAETLFGLGLSLNRR